MTHLQACGLRPVGSNWNICVIIYLSLNSQMAAMYKFMVAQASRLCCEKNIFLAPARRRCHDFRALKLFLVLMTSFG